MRTALLILPLLALGGCVSGGAAIGYGTFAAPFDDGSIAEPFDRTIPFCENYARQTYGSALSDTLDAEDGVGARQFSRVNAERAADRAYQRCLEGRTN